MGFCPNTRLLPAIERRLLDSTYEKVEVSTIERDEKEARPKMIWS